MRALQAAESNTTESRVYRICDLPLYPKSSAVKETNNYFKDSYPRNAVEEQISVVRKSFTDFCEQYKATFDSLKLKTEIGIEHSKGSLDYIQNNPGELPRVIFITVAGMGGIVLGYKGGVVKKLIYASIGAFSSAALCYPKKSVDLTHQATDLLKASWKEFIGSNSVRNLSSPTKGGLEKEQSETVPEKDPNSELTPTFLVPSYDSNQNKEDIKPSYLGVSTVEKKKFSDVKKLKGDPGQSNPVDKDLYSTRSS
ncbi:MICOS complex subunit Mic27-like isoform X2 [Physella acuta]|nr:MICOS complex subunit Mic27-like isoform X2 [Physella acuta]